MLCLVSHNVQPPRALCRDGEAFRAVRPTCSVRISEIDRFTPKGHAASSDKVAVWLPVQQVADALGSEHSVALVPAMPHTPQMS